MKYWCYGICLLLILACGCVAEEERGEAGELREYLLAAASYAEMNGKDAALAEFGRRDGAFTYDGRYVYAYDDDCILLAHPYEEASVGLNRSGWTDSRGLPVIRIGSDVAQAGGGYITYLYPRPGDAGIDEAAFSTYELKLGYVLSAGEGWWIGSGVALADITQGEGYPPVIRDMVALVEDGAAYAEHEGTGAARAAISDPAGRFVTGDGHYLYAYQYDGTLVAHPHLPELIGSNLIDREDQYGMRMIESLATTARDGGGFVVFIWPNPEEGNRDELKIGYVMAVDDDWWLGSGVYLSEVTGEYTPIPA
ncbi:signal transduction histidine kinase [Methanocalculus alkaliphilus]|uniref:cache domain-containing protein n=1 Tax=Methanocalculus alkaliphilus TaxID=768730 RepID=UPI00209E4F57|nr:cache domain-containing protein [Methanocalculus alkaliphilus]MCP1715673.1 signal transduction histidine kinase [Methanocalculus alkaliphilus]